MTNNDIMRRLRYLLNYNDQEMIGIFGLAEYEVAKEDVVEWLKKEEDPLYKEISDTELAIFLNGLIIEKRGRRDGPLPEPEDPLSNNMIFQKLRIALNLTSEDIIALFASIDKEISKHELDTLDKAIYYEENIFSEFFAGAKERLLPDGRLLFFFSNLAQITNLTEEHPVEKELAEGGRFKLERCFKKSVSTASKKTKRDPHWRDEETVELWELSHK